MNAKMVIRYKDGRIVKGHIEKFSEKSDFVKIRDESMGIKEISIDELKAIFFVRSFEGRSQYRELKKYGICRKKGDRVFVKFFDGELLIGFLLGDVPWDKKKGYYLSKKTTDRKGFYIVPVDEESNNEKIFITISAVSDVTIMK